MKASAAESVNRLLRDVCSVIDGAIDPQRHPDEQFAHFSIPAFDTGLGPVSEFGRDIHSNKLEVCTGCILFSKLNPRIPRVWHVQDALSLRGICSTEFLVLQPDRATVDSDYLVWMLQTPVFLYAIRSRVQAATKSRERVPDNVVLSTPIPLPSLSEQRRIAAKLDEQMATLACAQAALAEQRAAATALRSAVLHTALDPATHLRWHRVRLGDATKVIGGSTPDSSNPAYWNGSITWVTPVDLGQLRNYHLSNSQRHITTEGFKSASIEMIPPGSVIMSSRAPIGHLAISDIPVSTNQGCKSFIPGPSLYALFLYYVLRLCIPDLQAIGGGATFAEVSKSKLEDYVICFPDLAEQRRVADQVDRSMKWIDMLLTSVDEEAATLDALRTSLLDAAFRGEV